MSWATMEKVAELAGLADAQMVDITGGEPSLHPDLRRFVEVLVQKNAGVQVRTNLTGLLEPGNETLPESFRGAAGVNS